MKITDFHSLLDTGASEELPTSPLNGRELQELVNPISNEEFVGSYFSRTSLSVKGSPSKFDHIFSWERLRQALARGQHITDKRYNIKASFTGGEDSGSSRQMIEAQHNQVAELLNGGATICITNIHMADPFLAKWAQAIRAQLNFTGTVGINCYVSPDGSGLPMHYDKRVATTLQIAGKKRWKFSLEPAKTWPDSNEVYIEGEMEDDVGKLPPDMEFREVELHPGDLLCLPAGAWHSARGIGHSLALNLYFAPRNLFDQFLPLFQKFAAKNEHWRGGSPATLEKIQGSVPQATSAYMHARLEELNNLVQAVVSSSDLPTELWLTSLTQAPYTGWQPDPLLSIPEATADQRFYILPSSLRFVEIQNKLVVSSDNGLLKFPMTLAPIFQRLAAEIESFTIPEVLSWQKKPDGPSPNEIMAYLKILYSNGILKKV